jgi:hypothetical protein
MTVGALILGLYTSSLEGVEMPPRFDLSLCSDRIVSRQ